MSNGERPEEDRAKSIPPPPRTPSVRPPSTRVSTRPPSLPPDPQEELPLPTGRDRFAAGLLLPVALVAIAANAVGDLLAPGWVGVGGDALVHRWRWWGTVTPLAAAMLGVVTAIALVMAAVGNPRTSISTRMVATFGAGLVLTLVMASLRDVLGPKILIVIFAGAFAVLVAGAVEALSPPATRGLGVLLALYALSALLRVSGWGLAWSATHGHPQMTGLARAAASGSLVAEIGGQAFAVLYLIYRPGWRGAIFALVAIGVAFIGSTWALGTTLDAAGTFRDALQRALTLRIQGSGPSPSWVNPMAMSHEIALLDRGVRLAVLPLVFAELASITLAMAALGAASRPNLPLVTAMALVLVSRGQVDTPLRALELAVAALAALVLARGARVAAAPTGASRSVRPPPL